jgi:hypothetical protein
MNTLVCPQNWIPGFAGCSMVQLYAEKVVAVRNARYITCSFFQIYFVANALYIILAGLLDTKDHATLREMTISNINDMYGYFLYDVIFILIDYPDITFILHHVISMVLIDLTKGMGIEETFYHNAVCVLLETPSPFLNFRYIVRDYFPELRVLNNSIIYWSYLTCRIIAFPVIYFLFIGILKEQYFYGVSLGLGLIYLASVVWFLKISKLLF